MNYHGPFFVKINDKYVLADPCENCAFGDEKGCCLTVCTYLYGLTVEDETSIEEEIPFTDVGDNSSLADIPLNELPY